MLYGVSPIWILPWETRVIIQRRWKLGSDRPGESPRRMILNLFNASLFCHRLFHRLPLWIRLLYICRPIKGELVMTTIAVGGLIGYCSRDSVWLKSLVRLGVPTIYTVCLSDSPGFLSGCGRDNKFWVDNRSGIWTVNSQIRWVKPLILAQMCHHGASFLLIRSTCSDNIFPCS
jgi:hypothetical protein